MAAASLRLIPTAEARNGLLTCLRRAEPILRIEAIKSLGAIGDEATLEALTEVGPGEATNPRATYAGNGLYKSTDGGETLTDISRNPGLPSGVLGKIGIAVSPADPNSTSW